LNDYRALYRELRNYLAGQHVGSTRDEALVPEVVKALLCKADLDVRQGFNRSTATASDYRQAWGKVRARLPRLLQNEGPLAFEDAILEHIDALLHPVDLHSHDHDALGDLYEIFMGSLARGQQGQFFTPTNAVQLLVDLVQPQSGEVVLDPACGAGGFLAASARYVMQTGELTAPLAHLLWGIDKDSYLSRLAALRIAILTGAEANILCADSLSWRGADENASGGLEGFSRADVILTNPPFGSKIVALAPDVQQRFSLGHRWVQASGSGRYVKTQQLLRSVSPQVAFVERCIQLLKTGGRLGMVVPESLLSSSGYGYVVQFIRDRMDIQAVVGMPETLFKTSGSGGTHTKTCLLVAKKAPDEPGSTRIFMAEAHWCGNDSRGRRVGPDELPVIASRYRESASSRPTDHLSYEVDADHIVGNVLVPRYYDPEVSQLLESLRETHDLVRVDSLIESGVIEIRAGDEIGRESYGTGNIPFVRTSDISNWEIKLDPKHGVSEDVYSALASKQDVREGDILIVRDGTYLIGTCAYVTKYDERIVYQSHVLKLRVLKPDVLSPYLLLACFTSIPVKRQIAAKRFTQDIIDSLGSRIREIELPLPRDPVLRNQVIEKVSSAIQDRMEARELARQACIEVTGLGVTEAELMHKGRGVSGDSDRGAGLAGSGPDGFADR